MIKDNYDIKDPALAEAGQQRIEWAYRQMPVIKLIRERFGKEKPLKNIRLSACLHVTTETANLVLTLRDGGAEVILCAANPLSTQDDVAAALVKEGIPVNAVRGEDEKRYYKHIDTVLDHQPQLTVDDGADLVTTLHTKRTDLIGEVIGGTEETTTGVIRLRSLEKAGRLKYPMIAVNDARTKYLFDNRYGTGQSTIDGVTRATNILWSGKTVVVCGYGWCGHGAAMRAQGLGGRVIVTEVEPVRALEAVMDGYQVMPIAEAAKIGDVFITITGDINVIDKAALEEMKDGAILANSGHFDVEINIPALAKIAKSKRTVKPMVDEYTLKDGRRLYLLAEGRVVNLSAAEGHPAAVMDMSFANQALSVEHMVKNRGKLKVGVYPVPTEIDEQVARLKLNSMGVHIDILTPEQKQYLESWEQGT